MLTWANKKKYMNIVTYKGTWNRNLKVNNGEFIYFIDEIFVNLKPQKTILTNSKFNRDNNTKC